MHKLTIDSARVQIRTSWMSRGSVLAGTVEAIPQGFRVSVSIGSKEPSDKVLFMLRNAERSCFVQQTIEKPVEVTSVYSLNGREVDVEG